MSNDVYNIVERVPRWYRDDGLVKALNDLVEETKLETYYKTLCSYPIQPIQVWKKTEKTTRIRVTSILDNTNQFEQNIITGTDTLKNTTGFTSLQGASLSSSGGIAYKGERSLKFVCPNSVTGEGVYVSAQVDDAGEYTASAQIYAPYNSTLEVKLTNHGSITETLSVTGLGIWQEVTLTVNTTGADTLYFEIYTRGSAQPITVYCDAFGLGETTEHLIESAVFDIPETQEITPDIEVIVPYTTTTQEPISGIVFYGCLEDLEYTGDLYPGDTLYITPDGVAKLNGMDVSDKLIGDHPIVGEVIETEITKYNLIPPVEVNFYYGQTGSQIINVRAMAHEEYPLKEIKIYDEYGVTLFSKEYSKWNKVTYDWIQEPAPGVEKFYTEIQYHKIQGSIKRGFPQVTTTTDSKYLINEILDVVAAQYGIKRRVYKSYVAPRDHENTYPPFYPYPIEQDYYLEERLLEEYVKRDVAEDYDYLIDLNDEKVAIIEIDSPRLHDIIIITQEDKLTLKDFEKDGSIYTEEFEFNTILELVNHLNWDSKILKASFIKEGAGKLEYSVYDMQNNGRYETFGLLKSEIYQYLGVIPTIKNVSDYVMIWDEDEWNFKVWAGDEWSTGIFQVQIPYGDIPTNFDLLTYDELQVLIDKCRPIGTKGYPMYWHESYVELAFEQQLSDIQFRAEISLPKLEFTAVDGDSLSRNRVTFSVQTLFPETMLTEYLNSIAFAVEAHGAIYSNILQQTASQIHANDIPQNLIKFETIGTGTTFVSDNFNDNSIDYNIWTMDKEAAASVTESGSKLNLILPSGSGDWNPGVGAPNGGAIMRTPIPSGDWEAVVKLTSQTQSVGCATGLTLFQNRSNAYNLGIWTTTGYPSTPISYFAVERFIGGASTNGALTGELYASYPVWLKIRKEGSEYKFLYSYNGTNFRVFYATSSLGITPTHIGVFGKKWSGSADSSFDDFQIIQTPSISEFVGIDEDLKRYSIGTTNAYNEDDPIGSLAWRHFGYLWDTQPGYAAAGAEGSGWLNTDYLVTEYNMSSIPTDAEIYGFIVGHSVYITQATPSNAQMNMRYNIQVGSRTWSNQKWFGDGLQGWKEYWRGWWNDLWGYTGPVTGAEVRQKMRVRFSCGGIGTLPANYVGVDWMTLHVFYKKGSGMFCTSIQPTTNPTPPNTAHWGTLEQTLLEPLASGCSVKYDIFKEVADQTQIQTNSYTQLGTVANKGLCQSFITGTNKITGVKVKTPATAKVGSPTASIQCQIRPSDSNGAITSSSSALGTYVIPYTAWTNNTELEFNFDVTVTPGAKYWIVLDVLTGSGSNTNYYNIAYQNINVYNSGDFYRWDSSTGQFNLITGDLYFQTLKPINLLVDQVPNIPLIGIEYTNIKARGKLARTNTSQNPKVTGITINREEIINE